MQHDLRDVVIATGADSNFFHFLIAALRSLRSLSQLDNTKIAVFDQGLTADQLKEIRSLNCTIVTPEWNIPVPEHLQDPKAIGLVARVGLRKYLPGYKFYIWFDADAWAQTPGFLNAYISGAEKHGAAVSREPPVSFVGHFREQKWWFGNMILSYGTVDGLRAALSDRVNIGILCMRYDTPLWESWEKRYVQAITASGKINMDQHAFVAAVRLDRLAVEYLGYENNWQPTLTKPNWDPVRKLMCDNSGNPISIIHLSGPQKERSHSVSELGQGVVETKLTYEGVRNLFGEQHAA